MARRIARPMAPRSRIRQMAIEGLVAAAVVEPARLPRHTNPHRLPSHAIFRSRFAMTMRANLPMSLTQLIMRQGK